MLVRIAFVIALALALLSLVLPGQAGIGVGLAAVAAICLTAVVAAVEAGRAGRFVWVVGLLLIAALLNPVMPVALPRPAAVLLLAMSLAMLASWMIVLNRVVPSQSIAQVLHPQDPR
jgi:hypothetical protein